MHQDRDDELLIEELRLRRRGGALRWALIWAGVSTAIAFVAPALLQHLKAPAPPAAQAAMKPQAQRVDNTSTFRADASGHFIIDAAVNGTAVRFLVDTGATYVVLSDQDAAAAGINRNLLTFDRRFSTANGEAHGALVTLREIRLGQLVQTEVPAVVLETPVSISLLGMSFLRRLDRYEIRDGELVMSW